MVVGVNGNLGMFALHVIMKMKKSLSKQDLGNATHQHLNMEVLIVRELIKYIEHVRN